MVNQYLLSCRVEANALHWGMRELCPPKNFISAILFLGALMLPERPSIWRGQCSKCYPAMGWQMQVQLPGGPSEDCLSQVGVHLWDLQGAVEGHLSYVEPLALLPFLSGSWPLPSCFISLTSSALSLWEFLYLPSRWPRISMLDVILELLSNAINRRNKMYTYHLQKVSFYN